MRSFAAFALASLLAFPFLQSARADAPPQPRRITSLAGITEYHLDNGLRVLLFPDQTKNTVTVNITYLVGSRHEGYGETGMAHLLEHMVFKGTPTFPQIWKSLQDHGAQFNGTTWYDRTNYFETLAATDENLDFALKLESDRMVNSFIAKKDLDSEFSVVRNEFEMGENNPVGILSERILSTAYLWHNYGKSTIGSREDIERVPIERLQAFYKKYYQPDNAVLVVAGKFDEASTLAKVNDYFGRIPRPARTLEKTYTVEPVQDGEREVVLRRVGDVQAIGAAYHICAGAHEDMAPLQVLAHILSADQTGRLYKALVETKLATSVSADAAQLHDPGHMEIMAEARLDQSIDAIRPVLLGLLDNLHQEKFTQEEVDRAVKSYLRTFDLGLNDSTRVGIRLTESAAQGDWRLMFLHRDRMAKVTPADVQRVAATYFAPSNRTVGVFIPTKEPARSKIPPTPDVAALLDNYKGEFNIDAGESFEATYANIERKTQRSALPFGMKLALLPKKTRGNNVNANIVFRYGSETDLTGRTDAASMLASMLMRGSKSMTRRQIQDMLAELKAQVRIGSGGGAAMGGGRFGRGMGGGPGALSVNIETTRENLLKVLELVGEVLRNPAFPQDEFDLLQKETLAGVEQSLSEPTALAMIELQRRMNPVPASDIRYVPTPVENLERIRAVKLEDVKSVYADLLGSSASEAAFVGDFNPDEVKATLDKLFSDWKSPKPYQRVETPYKPVTPDTHVINTPDKANAMFVIGTTLEIRDDDPDYPAAFMANYILGSNSNSRLLNRIRQKEGLSYGCGSTLAASSQDKRGTFLGYGICAPQNAEKALACAREEIERFIREGVTQQELDEARAGYIQQLNVGLSNDGPVCGMLAQSVHLGRTMKFAEEQLAKIKALTPKDVQGAFVKYVSPEKLVIIRAGDFEKRSAAAAAVEKSAGG